MADAAAPMRLSHAAGTVGVLHGLPVAHKDLVDTAGIRTTRGSPFYRDQVPTRDALLVARIRAAGALTLGKTNTPEFGAGSQTFNTVFGATRNPYDLHEDLWRQQRRRCGGTGLRDGAHRRRQRHWRIAAQPGGVLQRRGLQAIAGTGSTRGGVVVAVVGGWPHGAIGRRRGAVSQRDRGAGSEESVVHSGGWRTISARRLAVTSRARGSRGGVALAGFRSRRRSSRSSTASRRCSRTWGAVVEEAEPDFAGRRRRVCDVAIRRELSVVRAPGARAT